MSDERIVDTASGSVAGTVGAVAVFRGIPFAAAPVGALRWQQPAETSWTGIRDATKFGCDPIQVVNAAHESRAPGTSEDCLTLNIWAPADAALGSCPVMVWIDGGAFVTASGAKKSLDGTAFAKSGVVLVTFNYRVGVFGYLAHPALTKESPHSASGNYGVADQIAVLRWVRDNISAFGGNPENVTMFGVSAGGASAAALLISPLARGLFHRAILQSPGTFRPLCALRDAEQAGMVVGAALSTMRALPAAELLSFNTKIGPAVRSVTAPRPLRPIVDGWAIHRDEIPAFLSGDFADVPIIIGGVADEGSFFTPRMPIKTLEHYRAYVRDNFGDAFDDAWSIYGAANESEVTRSLAGLFGDTQFSYGARGLAAAAANKNPKTFRYLFTHRDAGETRAPLHMAETPYVFGTTDPKDSAMSKALMDIWIQFARTGDPNGPGLPAWPAYSAESDAFLTLANGFSIGSHWRQRELDFLRHFFVHES
jgi:carboxylesterase type B